MFTGKFTAAKLNTSLQPNPSFCKTPNSLCFKSLLYLHPFLIKVVPLNAFLNRFWCWCRNLELRFVLFLELMLCKILIFLVIVLFYFFFYSRKKQILRLYSHLVLEMYICLRWDYEIWVICVKCLLFSAVQDGLG